MTTWDTAARIERELLKRLFLRPGEEGPVEAIRLDQEELDGLSRDAGASSFDSAVAEALRTDGFLRRQLTGGLAPRYVDDRPSFLRILVLSCLVHRRVEGQGAGHRDYRRELSKVIGSRQMELRGLPVLWRSFADWLFQNHHVLLILPEARFPHIGVSMGLAFPTWRDRSRIEDVFRTLDERYWEQDDRLAAAFLRMSELGADAYGRHLSTWREAYLAGDPDAPSKAFWGAVSDVRASRLGGARLIVRPSHMEPGLVAAFRRRLDGREIPLALIPGETNVGSNGFRRDILRSAARGCIRMSYQGYGRWEDATDGSMVDGLLINDVTAIRSGLKFPSDALRVGTAGWHLLPGRVDPAANEPHRSFAIRRRGAIRAGAGLLHCYPYTPWHMPSSGRIERVELDGGELEIEEDHDGYVRPIGGRLDGRLHMYVDGAGAPRKFAVLAVSSAPEHHRDDLKTYSERFQHLDGPLAGTAPNLPVKNWIPSATSHNPNPEMVALGEALHARCRRGIGLGDAFGLANEIVEAGSPTGWDLLQTFVDSGWFEPIWVEGACAQMLLPRSTNLVQVGNCLLLDGLTGARAIARFRECADAAGAAPKSLVSGPWRLPTWYAEGDDQSLVEMARRYRAEAKEPMWKSPVRLCDVPPIAKLDGHPDVDADFRLRRHRRADRRGSPFWSFDTADGTEIYAWRTAAMLRLFERKGEPAFVWEDGRLLRMARGVVLPASWSRWLRTRTMGNAGPVPVEDGWGYAYPCDVDAAAALSTLTSAVEANTRHPRPSWTQTGRHLHPDLVRVAIVGGTKCRLAR